jgi:hypothetical protein
MAGTHLWCGSHLALVWLAQVVNGILKGSVTEGVCSKAKYCSLATTELLLFLL